MNREKGRKQKLDNNWLMFLCFTRQQFEGGRENKHWAFIGSFCKRCFWSVKKLGGKEQRGEPAEELAHFPANNRFLPLYWWEEDNLYVELPVLMFQASLRQDCLSRQWR